MSVSVLSLTSSLGSVPGLLQAAALLSLVLLLLKATQLYLRRQWLLQILQQFPSPPSHWLFGHKDEVKKKGGWGVGGQGVPGISDRSHGQQAYETKPCGVSSSRP